METEPPLRPALALQRHDECLSSPRSPTIMGSTEPDKEVDSESTTRPGADPTDNASHSRSV